MMSNTSVRVSLEFVRNLGNYESIRISIGIEDAVRQGETVDQATERVYAFVENKLIEKSNEIEAELKGNKK
jgi:hypothetical protein